MSKYEEDVTQMNVTYSSADTSQPDLSVPSRHNTALALSLGASISAAFAGCAEIKFPRAEEATDLIFASILAKSPVLSPSNRMDPPYPQPALTAYESIGVVPSSIRVTNIMTTEVGKCFANSTLTVAEDFTRTLPGINSCPQLGFAPAPASPETATEAGTAAVSGVIVPISLLESHATTTKETRTVEFIMHTDGISDGRLAQSSQDAMVSTSARELMHPGLQANLMSADSLHDASRPAKPLGIHLAQSTYTYQSRPYVDRPFFTTRTGQILGSIPEQPVETGLIATAADRSQALTTSNINIVTSEAEAELDKSLSDTLHADDRIKSTSLELMSSSYVALSTHPPKPEDPPPGSPTTAGKQTNFHGINKEGIALSVGIVSGVTCLGIVIFLFAQRRRKKRNLEQVKCARIQSPQRYDPDCSYFSLDTGSL